MIYNITNKKPANTGDDAIKIIKREIVSSSMHRNKEIIYDLTYENKVIKLRFEKQHRNILCELIKGNEKIANNSYIYNDDFNLGTAPLYYVLGTYIDLKAKGANSNMVYPENYIDNIPGVNLNKHSADMFLMYNCVNVVFEFEQDIMEINKERDSCLLYCMDTEHQKSIPF